MGIEFKSTELFDIVIFSGENINFKSQVPTGLIGEAAETAFESLNKSYQEYKKGLNLNYGQFLNNFETNYKELNQTAVPSHIRKSVASKLSELANRRITQKESNFSCLHKFFHKLGQKFKGHGFRTKGEWGLTLALRMEKPKNDNNMSILQNSIFHGLGLDINETPPKEVIGGLKDYVNELSEALFKDLLNNIIFKKKENHFLGCKNKLFFYKNLNEDKKNVFNKELLLRKDWYSQAFDIIEGADSTEDLTSIITSGMIKRFQNNPSQFIKIYKNISHKNVWVNKFFCAMIASSVKDYLTSDSPEGFININNLLTKSKEVVINNKMLNEEGILTSEEISKLHNNINKNLL